MLCLKNAPLGTRIFIAGGRLASLREVIITERTNGSSKEVTLHVTVQLVLEGSSAVGGWLIGLPN
jgi:hypothetical protein